MYGRLYAFTIIVHRRNTCANELRHTCATRANMRLAGMSRTIKMAHATRLCTSATTFALRTRQACAHQSTRRQSQRNVGSPPLRACKKSFLETVRKMQFARKLREFAQTSAATQTPARVRDQCNARAKACANRPRSASVFVSVAHTSNAFSYSGYSSPRAKPATISSCARRSTTTCAEHGNLIATS